MTEHRPLRDLLAARVEEGPLPVDDVLALVLPLLDQVAALHERGLVAPLDGIADLRVDGGQAWFPDALAKPPRRNARVRDLGEPESRALDVVGHARVVTDVDVGSSERRSLDVADGSRPVERPGYVPGFRSWEQTHGHHDPLTDTFVLGLILGNLLLALDLGDETDLRTFESARENLFRLNPELNPVFAKAIVRMTDLDRHRRPQDLARLRQSLENYRDQEIDFEFDLARLPGFRDRDSQGRRQVILSRLQERLFEVSRRNRLLHFRATLQSANLTTSSVPMVLDVRNIRPGQLLTWGPTLRRHFVDSDPVPLGKYLRFEDHPFLPAVLDQIRAEARRDRAEYGFSQLRLVACMLRWTDLKETKERFESPLVLLPVELEKKKGIRDAYLLKPLTAEAEVNPVVRHVFRQNYGIDLPESLDLATTDLDAFFDYLSKRIQASEPGVTLEKIGQPRVEIIHDRARRRLDQYRRRARTGARAARSFQSLEYSYAAENFAPLGLRLFESRVRLPETRLRSLLEEVPRSRHFAVPEPTPPAAAERDSLHYHLRSDVAGNPYHWEFDLCSVTLTNLRSRKMSLVRDYEALLAEDVPNSSFERVFSLAPRAPEEPLPEEPFHERYPVVPCDPTQAASIAAVVGGRSLIIQGPPGTGKSQTITNLIAELAARGKRVLFVCEKRAAIDVVHHRLRQSGLEQLVCLIHDSQQDKKAVIQDLKATYETWLAHASDEPGRRERQRDELVREIQRELAPIDRFDRAIGSVPEGAGRAVGDLIDRLLELRPFRPALDPLAKERLPPYRAWTENEAGVGRFRARWTEIQPSGVFATHPLRRLSPSLADEERPLDRVSRAVSEADSLLDELVGSLGSTALEKSAWNGLARIAGLADYSRIASPFLEKAALELLEPESRFSGELARLLAEQERRAADLARRQEKTRGWVDKLGAIETEAALGQARAVAGVLGFLSPAWWRLRALLRSRYDFRSGSVRPTWVQVLEWLLEEHRAIEALGDGDDRIAERFGLGRSGELRARIEEARSAIASAPRGVRDLHARLVAGSGGGLPLLRDLSAAGRLAGELAGVLEGVVESPDELDLDRLRETLAGIRQSLSELPEFLSCLASLAALPKPLADAFRNLPCDARGVEAALADKALEDAMRSDRVLARFSSTERGHGVRRVEEAYRRWLAANAATVLERTRARFLEHVRLSSLPEAGMTAEQKGARRAYARGRKELEREIGKSMRFRSIRELLQGEAGPVIADLKPVWLMSPLSVSDTLPMDGRHFDVTIFDEASQIRLEDAVPCLFRSGQVVVVGDQMQLPPTSFFASAGGDDEALTLEEDGELVEYDLDSDSLLHHSEKSLPSTMLGWHYRSRSESLISFSNAAFYGNGLLTVPEIVAGDRRHDDIRPTALPDGEPDLESILLRPVSFHFLEHGTYVDRRNEEEARHIARLVRGLLARPERPTIAVIAFSEAQQGEIESALGDLAAVDEVFRKRYEAEIEREDDDQFVGLLVKNLENIQGDERDVVILSVCYGHDPNGRMRMNFGPINQSGGERRLNVAFSRAKRHMMVVSSIRESDITNDYNDGAHCLKRYLRYAEAVSRGERDTAHRVLDELSPRRRKDATSVETAVAQLAEALRGRGLEVDLDVGSSRFRCPIAVKRPGDREYRLGIFLDTRSHYAETDILGRDVQKPALLRAFGWTTEFVLTREWLLDPDGVLARLEARIRGEEPVAPLAVEPESRGEAPAGARIPVVPEPSDRPGQSDRMPPPLEPTLLPHAPSAAVEPLPAGPPATVEGTAVDASAPGTPPIPGQSLPPDPAAPPPDPVSFSRYLEFVGGTSSKFWEIRVEGNRHTVRFGRIGTTGHEKTVAHATPEAARADARKLADAKTRKGYVDATPPTNDH